MIAVLGRENDFFGFGRKKIFQLIARAMHFT